MSTNDFAAYLIRDAYEREAAMVTARAKGKAILAAAKAGTNKETPMASNKLEPLGTSGEVNICVDEDVATADYGMVVWVQIQPYCCQGTWFVMQSNVGLAKRYLAAPDGPERLKLEGQLRRAIRREMRGAGNAIKDISNPPRRVVVRNSRL